MFNLNTHFKAIMKKIFTTILLAAAAVTGIQAATVYRLGYCSGEVSQQGIEAPAGNVSAAIYLPAERLKSFAGDRIEGVAAGLVTKRDVSSVTVWVRSALDGTNLSEGTIDIDTPKRPADGWNDVTLTTPVEISGNEGLYVGYTVHQLNKATIVATDGRTEPGEVNIKFGDNEGWTSPNCMGSLSIEALVTGDKMPQLDLQLMSAETENLFVQENGEVSVKYELRNNGEERVSSYELALTVDGKTFTAQAENVLAYGVKRTYRQTFKLEGLKRGGPYNMTLTVLKPNGKADENDGDNTKAAGSITVTGGSYQRVVLLEEFTTEQCSNCPAAAQTLAAAIGRIDEKKRDNLVIVCHHAGYHTDWLTQPCDESMLWLYNNNGSVYAPAFMVDRTVEQGKTPVFQNPGTLALQQRIESAMDEEALVSVEVKGKYDEATGKLDVTVIGERSANFCDDPRVTVYVCQDNVEGRKQSGYGNGYIHNHVIRAYNSTWGDNMEWTGDNYTYSTTLDVSSEYNKEDLYIVAAVNNYNSSNASDNKIYNAARVAFNQLTELSVAGISDCEATDVRIYDLTGRELGGMPDHGIVIVTGNVNGVRKARKVRL